MINLNRLLLKYSYHGDHFETSWLMVEARNSLAVYKVLSLPHELSPELSM